MPVEQEKKTVLPLTGKEYLESLKDGREIWINPDDVSYLQK